MWKLAIRNLFDERGRLAISVSGVGAALLLVLLLDGVFAGTSEQIVAYPAKTRADVWVMQNGVSNMHMATSLLDEGHEHEIRKVSGVRDVTPILYVNNFVHAGGREWFSYVVGLRPEAKIGGPWAMSRGSDRPGVGEVVLPFVIADQTGLSIGDDVTIMGRSFRIVGLSNETYSMANSISFVHYRDLAELMSTTDQASYFLVQTDAGAQPGEVAMRLRRAVSEIHAMTRSEFVASDRTMAMQMGTDVIRVMAFVGFVASILIIGFTLYTATMRRRRELAVAKALGVSNRQLLGTVLVQTVVLVALALTVAIGLAFAVRPLIHALVPEVAIIYPLPSILKLAAGAAVVSVIAAWLPSRRVLRIDPALVFKE